MDTPYFNETGPIYQTECVQASAFVDFVRAHVVVESMGPGKETAWFGWEKFRDAVMGLSALGVTVERELDAVVPPTTGSNSDTTVQAVLDALLARFASGFAGAPLVTVPSAEAEAKGDVPAPDPDHFFAALQRNVYHAFTHHLKARLRVVPDSDAPERCLSFHAPGSPVLGPGPGGLSGWEYRLLFVHSDVRSGSVKGLVMTVTLQRRAGVAQVNGVGNDLEEAWREAELEARGPYSGTVRAMQVVVGEGFRWP